MLKSYFFNSFFFSPLEQFDVSTVFNLSFFNYFDLSINSVLMPLVLIIITIVLLDSLFREEYSIVPTNIQKNIELLVEFVYNLVKQQIGEEGYIFLPLICTLFNFILWSNYLSMLPFGIALVSHIIIILWLSLSLCLSIYIYGLRRKHLQFLKIFIPECPFFLLPLLVTIEIFSYIIRSLSLAIRLSANIMAGHTLVHIISSVVLVLMLTRWWLFSVGFVLLYLILLLELGVAFLQAYVYCTLVCIYINDIFNSSH